MYILYHCNPLKRDKWSTFTEPVQLIAIRYRVSFEIIKHDKYRHKDIYFI